MNKTALIYSFNTKKTGKIAEKIKEEREGKRDRKSVV